MSKLLAKKEDGIYILSKINNYSLKNILVLIEQEHINFKSALNPSKILSEVNLKSIQGKPIQPIQIEPLSNTEPEVHNYEHFSKIGFETGKNGWNTLTKNLPLMHHFNFQVFAVVVATSNDFAEPQLISLATGTKWLPQELFKIFYEDENDRGKILLDSHAEILAVRGLMAYLYEELIKALKNGWGTCELEILEFVNEKYKLKDGVKLHLYVNKPPCGSSKPAKNPLYPIKDPNSRSSKYDKLDSYYDLPPVYESSFARILSGQQACVRPTCSDKMLKMNVLGVQGSLLHNFIEPTYFSSITVSEEYDSDNFCNAFFGRLNENKLKEHFKKYNVDGSFKLNRIQFGRHQPDNDADQNFANPEYDENTYSYNWHRNTNNPNSPIEIFKYEKNCVKKYDHKTSKFIKNDKTTHFKSQISKISFGNKFLEIKETLEKMTGKSYTERQQNAIKEYSKLKKSNTQYVNAKNAFMDTFDSLGGWISAPEEVDQFNCDILTDDVLNYLEQFKLTETKNI